ncbi:MAG TPA: Na+/H+ antiporter NhaA [Bacteroidaceae bacterium]|nr:Na+/H+ antiporter NhaA [Bacteroidaceae bacterium]
MSYKKPQNHYVGYAVRQMFNKFFRSEASSGIVLLIFAALAIVCANNKTLSPYYTSLFAKKIGITIQGLFSLNITFSEWINDGLMAIFFLVVGLEIKRETLVGQLSSFKKAALPIIAAIGGMVVPVLIFTFFNHNSDTANGWGIPMATDIAFALGILSLLGNRVSNGLKIFLAALAIADDLGAIIVIALFYPSNAISNTYLILAAIVTAILFILNRLRVKKAVIYALLGILLWYFMLNSGIHATISGVILAMAIPAKSTLNEVQFLSKLDRLTTRLKATTNSETSVLTNPEEQAIIHGISVMTNKVNPSLHQFQETLQPWSNWFIMPLFAFANAGVIFDASLFTLPLKPIIPGIFLGLILGKPIGIFLSSWIAVKMKIAVLPKNTKWVQILSMGIVAGIGFTMAIFVENLAFLSSGLSPEKIAYYVNIGKTVILITSTIAAALGLIALMFTCPKEVRKK